METRKQALSRYQTSHFLTHSAIPYSLCECARQSITVMLLFLQHPAVYRCIFIEKTRYGDEFESSAERWSIGVTMYQVATGRLPFQVLGGRGNREMM